MKLSPEQITQFHRDGFIVVPQLIDHATVQKLRDLYDKFLNHEIDAGESDALLGGLTRQVMHAHKYHPYFQDNPALTAARQLAGQLLNKEINFQFDMLISKQPGNTNETPWHQDWAYSAMPVAPAGKPIINNNLQFWVALDDVDEQNGCMQFIPGQHEGVLLEHFIASGEPTDPRRLLATTKVDPALAIACPLSAGGCTIHTMGTPHYTGGNMTTDKNRRAYIFNLCGVDGESA